MKTSAVVTGGGTQAVTRLLARGGYSDKIHEYTVPYSYEAFDRYVLRSYIAKHCSKDAAMMLAANCWHKMKLDREKECQVIACTASLYSEGQRRGRKNEAHIIELNDVLKTVRHIHLEFAENDGSRFYQETVVQDRLICLINNKPIDFAQNVKVTETVETLDQLTFDTLLYLFQQKVATKVAHNKTLVMCGSFNPVHEGHLASFEAAYSKFTKDMEKYTPYPVFEVSSTNADKCATYSQLVDNFVKLRDIVNQKLCNNKNSSLYEVPTNIRIGVNPYFKDKVKQYLNSTFVVGSDTILRIGNPKYYVDFEKDIQAMLDSGANFAVFLRDKVTIQDIKREIPLNLFDSCYFDAHEFNEVSSTKIRESSNV